MDGCSAALSGRNSEYHFSIKISLKQTQPRHKGGRNTTRSNNPPNLKATSTIYLQTSYRPVKLAGQGKPATPKGGHRNQKNRAQKREEKSPKQSPLKEAEKEAPPSISPSKGSPVKHNNPNIAFNAQSNSNDKPQSNVEAEPVPAQAPSEVDKRQPVDSNFIQTLREVLAKDRELFAEQQAAERKLYIKALNNVISMGESHRSSSENKIGLLYELAMEQKLQSIVSRDFPHLVLHEIPTRRLYTEKDPHFATACSLVDNMVELEIDLMAFGSCPSRPNPVPRLIGDKANCVIVAEVTTSPIAHDDTRLFKKCKQLDLRVRFLEAYYQCPIRAAYLLAGHAKVWDRDLAAWLAEHKFTRLLELYKDNLFRVYIS